MVKTEPCWMALAKIKLLIEGHYTEIGRISPNEFTDIDEDRKTMIEKIDEILRKMKIPKKYLIAESFT